ncbi:MAG: purine-nucleoside phosphorylase [Candidatus Wallbacteria bacterium GWC2_49_35]|uniref:Uridine phosphorylase n=1 Tax=Candidatus Wallbacteria bacterium GWC2_49_35 TaxID=1817813 RepID=A0A1F7WXC8_9BACT|nr:MAG: purine-nucleoside phosphorylase [Candidatus Wallbacteria bacterium GWC2_49_35]HBC74600.1 purine-nucleoside phosphorylase [Candidatus Wallbacteria bacterium]
MSIHIGAKEGEIAKTVLLAGDPLRAKFVAENFLEGAACYNNVRGMLGYTGLYKGKRVSVQGSGMGIPSIAIYANELVTSYGVKNLIRIGSCGSMQAEVKLYDIILAMTACTDSSYNKLVFNGADYSPAADFGLLQRAHGAAKQMGVDAKVGNILATDVFYGENPDGWKLWAKYGVLAVEMETTALYTIAARHGVRALTILTVSDSLVTHEATTSEQREKTFTKMAGIALETAAE